jgi:hypothetical protein
MPKRCLLDIRFSTIAFLITIAMMGLSSVAAHAQITWTVLVIHGRFDPTSGCAPEQYGTFDHDQACAWNAGTPATIGRVRFVNWDAWNTSFDDPTWPGGEAVVHAAIFDNCDTNTNHYCAVICHSAGCAATEHFIAVCTHQNVLAAITSVMAAGSAAGGSDLADLEESLPVLPQWILDLLGFEAPLDAFLTTSYTRGAYDHNHMQTVPIRALAGTGGENGKEGALTVFPFQGDNSDTNLDCQQVIFNTHSMCSDSLVALHSSCGHNRVDSFQQCDSRLNPFNDTASTYNYHGWWISDRYLNVDNGPFSSMGKNNYNSTDHTYDLEHSQLKQLVTDEYSACHTVVGQNQFYCW